MKRTLVVTVGQTPQVVTGAVHALLHREQPWLPDRIILATTKLNLARIEEGDLRTLGAPLVGPRGRLREVFTTTGHAASYVEPTVLVARRASGEEVDDTREAQDVSAFADLLLEIVRDATSGTDSELYLCLAGGRKSVSFLAGQVMSLYGRSQDVLSHLLVAPDEFEHLGGFWHPAQADTILHPTSGKVIDPASAKVTLHHVPFIRLRAYLPQDEAFQGGRAPSYEGAVARASEALAIDRMVVDIPNGCIRVGPHEIKADPKELALAATIAYAARGSFVLSPKAIKQVMTRSSSDTFAYVWSSLRVISRLSHSSELASDLREGPGGFEQERRRTLSAFLYDTDIGEPMSRLRRRAREALAPALASKLFSPKGLGTGFRAENIEIRLPAEVHQFELSAGLSNLSFVDRG